MLLGYLADPEGNLLDRARGCLDPTGHGQNPSGQSLRHRVVPLLVSRQREVSRAGVSLAPQPWEVLRVDRSQVLRASAAAGADRYAFGLRRPSVGGRAEAAQCLGIVQKAKAAVQL